MARFLRDAEAIIEVARAQFMQITPEERDRLDDITGVLAGPGNTLFYQGPTADHRITRSHVRTIRPLLWSKVKSDYNDMVRIYFRHICSRAAVGRSRTRAQTRAPAPTCAVLENNFCIRLMTSGTDKQQIIAELTAASCLGEQFFKYDYIFIPNFEYEHWVLLGIAPKQRFIFVIDSIFVEDPRWNHEVEAISSLITQELDRANGSFEEEWLLMTPSYEKMSDIWENRTYVTQRDDHSCAVITCTNGLCLAFGYPLLCYSNDQSQPDVDDIPAKRERIALELLSGGFEPPYDYQVLTVPESLNLPFRTQGDEPRTRSGFLIPPNCQQPEQHEPPRTLTQGWMTGRRRRVGAPAEPTRRRKKKDRTSVSETPETPQLYVKNTKPAAAFTPYPRYTGKKWPRQFPRKLFEARVLSLNRKGLFDGKPKKKLLNICKEDELTFEGFESASRKTVKEFRKWMEQAAKRTTANPAEKPI